MLLIKYSLFSATSLRNFLSAAVFALYFALQTEQIYDFLMIRKRSDTGIKKFFSGLKTLVENNLLSLCLTMEKFIPQF